MITALKEYMVFNDCLPWRNYFLAAPSKGCSKCLWAVNAIPTLFSLKVTELPLGNGLATGIQLVFHGGGSRGDYWMILWHAGKVVYRDLHVAPSTLLLSR